MRLLLAAVFALGISAVPEIHPVDRAQAAECIGDNCPPPAGQTRGRDCEHERQEQTTS